MSENSPATWAAVDAFLESSILPRDATLCAAIEANKRAGLPPIDVSPLQGQALHLLARAARARRILEIGTLGGYSTIWLARALPEGGQLVTLELDPVHAAVARENLERAGVGSRVEVRVGPAAASLTALRREGAAPFDLTFIDADKPSTPDYYEHALALSAPGSLIIIDNVIRHGEVANPATNDPSAQVMRRFFSSLGKDPRVTPAVIPTVGVKGYDGLALAIVNG